MIGKKKKLLDDTKHNTRAVPSSKRRDGRGNATESFTVTAEATRASHPLTRLESKHLRLNTNGSTDAPGLDVRANVRMVRAIPCHDAAKVRRAVDGNPLSSCVAHQLNVKVGSLARVVTSAP